MSLFTLLSTGTPVLGHICRSLENEVLREGERDLYVKQTYSVHRNDVPPDEVSSSNGEKKEKKKPRKWHLSEYCSLREVAFFTPRRRARFHSWRASFPRSYPSSSSSLLNHSFCALMRTARAEAVPAVGVGSHFIFISWSYLIPAFHILVTVVFHSLFIDTRT